MKQPFFYVANWKMQKDFQQVQQFIINHGKSLAELAAHADTKIIIAPSFATIAYCFEYLDPAIELAAQDCSEHTAGAYTGQVDATTLQQVGCRFVLLGHSEARRFLGQSNQVIAQKMQQALAANLAPIVCIGETEQEYKQNETITVLQAQLASIEKILALHSRPIALHIAYEPVWSIGSGRIADSAYLHGIFDFLNHWAQNFASHTITLLYGGSIDGNNAATLKSIHHVHGFLIGSASLDFQKFQNIVSL